MTTQIVLTTILAVVQVISIGKWVKKVAEFDDNLWIEPTIILIIALFQYLIWK